jgi:uncharacterized damage-inducible protein DinB
MSVKDLEVLYDYGYWANKKLFDVIWQLTPDEFRKPVAGSYGSIRNTLVHMLSAEAGWLDRCGGPKRGPRLVPDDFPTVESVVQAWGRLEVQMRDFLSTLKDADLARRVEYSFDPAVTHSASVDELMQHAAIHGAHHRGQVALLLRVLGHAPGNVDMVIYTQTQGASASWPPQSPIASSA